MKPNNTIQVKTKNGTLQVKRLPEGFQVIAASHDLSVIHSMNLTDEAITALNFCVGYLVASEGLAKAEQEVAQVASELPKFEVGDTIFHKVSKQRYKVYGINIKNGNLEVKSFKTGETYTACDPKDFGKFQSGRNQLNQRRLLLNLTTSDGGNLTTAPENSLTG